MKNKTIESSKSCCDPIEREETAELWAMLSKSGCAMENPAMSGRFVDSPSFLNSSIIQVLSGENYALSRYFLDKNYFYSHCSEGDQEISMLACFWYLDFLDSQDAMVKTCDGFSIDQSKAIKLFRLLERWKERNREIAFPLDAHIEAIKRYLLQKPLLQMACATPRFPLRTQVNSTVGCFLNLYTYPETGGLCIYACYPCAGEYTVPGMELTIQLSGLGREHIALQDNFGAQGVLSAMRAAGIVTDVVKYAPRGNQSIPICLCDKGALSQFTHINRSFLDLDVIRKNPVRVQKSRRDYHD